MSIMDINLPDLLVILRHHPLVRLDEKVKRGFVVGSMATGAERPDSDIDILLEIEDGDFPIGSQGEFYRHRIQQFFVAHDIRMPCDEAHPQWGGRRIDLYFTTDADAETRPRTPIPQERLT